MERRYGDIPNQPGLPPIEVRLLVPGPDGEYERIPTPIDHRGLIDVPALIHDVKETIDSSYEWPTHLSVHHFYFPECMYEQARRDDRDSHAVKFRELPIHKGLVPRQFENWLHAITEPAHMPSEEVMHHRLEAWRVAHSLFESARKAVLWERLARRRANNLLVNPGILNEDFNGEDIIGLEATAQTLRRHFRGIERHMSRLESVPEEFRLVEPMRSHRDLAKHLGKIVAPRALTLVRAAAA